MSEGVKKLSHGVPFAFAPAGARSRQFEADSIFKDMRRGVRFHMEGSPQGDPHGRIVRSYSVLVLHGQKIARRSRSTENGEGSKILVSRT